MKKIFSILLSVGISTSMLFAQTTNAEGSKYQFKKLVHLDATPVQSQGQTGTCWSFSATSFCTVQTFVKRIRPVVVSMYNGDTDKAEQVLTLSKDFQKFINTGAISDEIRPFL